MVPMKSRAAAVALPVTEELPDDEQGWTTAGAGAGGRVAPRIQTHRQQLCSPPSAVSAAVDSVRARYTGPAAPHKCG
jgi:hypothetical protein